MSLAKLCDGRKAILSDGGVADAKRVWREGWAEASSFLSRFLVFSTAVPEQTMMLQCQGHLRDEVSEKMNLKLLSIYRRMENIKI